VSSPQDSRVQIIAKRRGTALYFDLTSLTNKECKIAKMLVRHHGNTTLVRMLFEPHAKVADTAMVGPRKKHITCQVVATGHSKHQLQKLAGDIRHTLLRLIRERVTGFRDGIYTYRVAISAEVNSSTAAGQVVSETPVARRRTAPSAVTLSFA
jgi:hypothetical protein